MVSVPEFSMAPPLPSTLLFVKEEPNCSASMEIEKIARTLAAKMEQNVLVQEDKRFGKFLKRILGHF